MPDCMPAEIAVGGALTRKTLVELVTLMMETTDLEYPRSLDEVAQSIASNGTIDGYHGDASWGKIDEIEDWCEENGVPFDRQSDAKYEYSGETRRFRPGLGDKTIDSDQDGGLTVPVADLLAMKSIRDFRAYLARNGYRWDLPDIAVEGRNGPIDLAYLKSIMGDPDGEEEGSP